MINRIFVTCRFEAIHRWPAAPDVVGWLRHPHRHMFHVRAEIDVYHDDREVEFFMARRVVLDEIEKRYADTDLGALSCEMIAEHILDRLSTSYPGRAIAVEVSEDGENGAIVLAAVDE